MSECDAVEKAGRHGRRNKRVSDKRKDPCK